MEYVIGAIVLVLLWRSLFGGRAKDTSAPNELERQTAQADQEWEGKRQRQQVEMEASRNKVLLALRAGLLKQKQIENVVESSSQFGFSKAELDELQSALHTRRRLQAVTDKQKCRVCGGPALPGEDLCYTHHAK